MSQKDNKRAHKDSAFLESIWLQHACTADKSSSR